MDPSRHDRLSLAVGSTGLALADETRRWSAWGTDGDDRLGRFLTRELPDSAIVLHHRRLPGSVAIIDQVVVASSGVWVIGARWNEGKVEQRDAGFGTSFTSRLVINGRDRTPLVETLPAQARAVRAAIAPDPLASEVEIRAAVCFVAANWGLWSTAFEIDGVLVCWPQHLTQRIGLPGRLTRDAVERLANRIAVALPSVGWS